MTPEIASTLITSGASLAVAIVSVIANNRILGFKVDELAKKVEKHNNLVERVAVIERDLKTNWNRVDEVKEDVKALERK